jgi:hypothetical protein
MSMTGNENEVHPNPPDYRAPAIPRVRLHLTFESEVGAHHVGDATPGAPPIRETVVEWDEPDARTLVENIAKGKRVAFKCELHGELFFVKAAEVER